MATSETIPAEAKFDHPVLTRIAAVIGARHIVTDPVDLEPHLIEYRGLYHGSCIGVVKPADTAEVAEIVRICADTRTPIVPQGGNTGLVGGGVPDAGAIVLSLARLDKIRRVDPVAYTMTVEGGCILADIQRVAEENDRLFPLSLASEGSCRIGGNLSTNAGGTAVLRYGTARELVLGLEVVLPDGRVLSALRGLRKDNTGYDLKQLFLGAEGTLGIITAAVIKLFPRPRDVATGFVAVTGPEAAIELLARARGLSGDAVSTFELMNRLSVDMVLTHAAGTSLPLAAPSDWYVLIEITSPRAGSTMQAALEDILANALEDGLVTDGAIAQSSTQRGDFWRLREEISDSQRPEGGSIKHDISIPIDAVPRFLDIAGARVKAAMPDVRIVAFGHVGDGNIHYNLSQPKGADKAAYLERWTEFNRIVHDVVQDLGGSFSAEHGIGRMKVEELAHYKSGVEVEVMQRIKAALDPLGIMNPGKVVPSSKVRS